MDRDALKRRVVAEIDAREALLTEVSHQIHEHPELNYEEHFAHDLLTSVLTDERLNPTRGAYDLPTAFAAHAGTTGPTIAVLCEYDALPEIGHGCGHNVIAAAGLGAGLALAAIAGDAGGQVRILGTPAEEGGGGKVKMGDRGAFADVDAAMMVHGAGADLLTMNCVAIQDVNIDFEGQAAHAAAAPHMGRNALDAAVLAYMNVAALRQHIQANERIHGIFTHGGDKPNIVPHRASQSWYVRSKNLRTLEPLKERFVACIEGGTTAAGCSCSFRWSDTPYSDMIDNGPMVESYVANMSALGRTVRDPRQVPGVVGSTDMGNVSYLVPSIHPIVQVSPPTVAIHTTEFARYARSESGDRAVLDGAKAMAMTVVDMWCDAALMDAVRADFTTALARANA